MGKKGLSMGTVRIYEPNTRHTGTLKHGELDFFLKFATKGSFLRTFFFNFNPRKFYWFCGLRVRKCPNLGTYGIGLKQLWLWD